jgi:hypothetical protein
LRASRRRWHDEPKRPVTPNHSLHTRHPIRPSPHPSEPSSVIDSRGSDDGPAVDLRQVDQQVTCVGADSAAMVGEFQCGGAVKVLDRTVSVVELRAAESQFTWRSGPSQYSWRSLNFWTFPVAVRGMASRNSTDVGAL